MTDLHIDFETRSAVDLRKTGVHVYAEDPTTNVWCCAYALSGDEPEIWIPEDPVPPVIANHKGTFVAHNAAFEIAIWSEIMVKRYGWPEAPPERWRCTMAQCLAMAMPAALADAAVAFSLEQEKDDKGRRLMLSMAKPRRVGGKLPARPPNKFFNERLGVDGIERYIGADGSPLEILWWNTDDRLERLYDYCLQDVRTEMALDKRTFRLRPSEQKLWVLDQKINNRGFVVDEAACHGAMAMVERTRKKINDRMKVVTSYKVGAATAVNDIRNYLAGEGVATEGLAADQVNTLLSRDDISDKARQVLELRQQGSKMSVAKINALLNGTSKDGRARGTLQYHAASTGRWGGRRFQPQNLKRPDKDAAPHINFALDLLRENRLDTFEAIFDDPIDMIGSCVRGLVRAPTGGKMSAPDFANIEGRVLAWLAGEDWKVQAFREYDAGTGPDLYKLAYSKSFGVPVEKVSGDERQVGKVQELALGYQGGPGAFQTMARGYGLNIGDRFDEIAQSAPELLREAEGAWVTYGSKSGMDKRNWLAAEVVKRGWRSGHPETVSLWTEIEECAIRAVQAPGQVINCGRLRFKLKGSFLFMALPSGRMLCYPFPIVGYKDTPWGTEKPLLTFYGQDTYTRKWGRTDTYGGKLTENAVQAIARDLLAEALIRLDDLGVETVLHVHDEAVLYASGDMSEADLEEICAVMSDSEPWADGLPVAAEGWIGDRYRK